MGREVSSELVLGIDFGTSFSTAAAWVGGQMYVVPDHRGEPCIPSIVSYPKKGAPIVGARALQLRAQDPVNTISGVKRIIGRAHSAPEVRVFDAHNAVQTQQSPNGGVVLSTQAGAVAPTQVASEIFAYLKALAEQRFRTSIRKAVITVPASASAAAQDATKQSACAAGLEVVRILSEPSAGAIANNLDAFKGERRVLVYDFGGGTFDVTVLEQRDSSFVTRALSGDACLGGDDFDDEVASLVSGHLWKTARTDVTKDVVRWDRLIRASEVAKRGLSALEQVPLRLNDAYSANGQSRDFELALGRSDIEPRWKKLVDRASRITVQTMVAAKLRPAQIDVILLVGGTTYIPLVRRTVESVMKRPGVHEGDPQTAVARGAALVAARALDLAA